MNMLGRRHESNFPIIGCVAITVALAFTGCGVPAPPAQTADIEDGPPEPVYGDADTLESQQTKTAKTNTPKTSRGASAIPSQPTGRKMGKTIDQVRADNAAATRSKNSAKPAKQPGGKKLVQAKPGVGKKGHYGSGGLVTTSVSALFRTKERMKFYQIQDGLKKFNAMHGRWPKDYDEVMEKVIRPRGIRMPQLNPGQYYTYLPEKGQEGLMVVK